VRCIFNSENAITDAEGSVIPADMEDKKLYFYQNKDNTIINAYDHIVFNVIEAQTLYGYKSFVFCGCEPRVGTTSIVIELSILLAHLGKRVLILDGDYRRLSTHKRLNDVAKKGMSDFVRDPYMNLTDCIYASNIERLHALSSGTMVNQHPRQILYSPRFKEALEQLKKQYDFILIDSCALDTTSDVLALASFADATVLICALNGASKSKLVKAHQKLTKIKCNLIGVIENMVDMHEYESYMDDYDYYTLASRSAK
jgi:tyrosine-protein kinase Etk/Wzc